MSEVAPFRRCKSCGLTKPISEFHKFRKNEIVRRSTCRTCNGYTGEAEKKRKAALNVTQAHVGPAVIVSERFVL